MRKTRDVYVVQGVYGQGWEGTERVSLTPEQLAYLRADLLEHGTAYVETSNRTQVVRYLEGQRLSVNLAPSGAHIRIELARNVRWCGTCKHYVPLSDFSSAKMKWCRACNREMVKRKYWKRKLRTDGPSAVLSEISALRWRIAWLQDLLDKA